MSATPEVKRAGRPATEMTPELAVQKLAEALGTRVASALNKLEQIGNCGNLTSHLTPEQRQQVVKQVLDAINPKFQAAMQALVEGKRKPKPTFNLTLG